MRRVAVKLRDHLFSAAQRAATGLPIADWVAIAERFRGVRAIGMFAGVQRDELSTLMGRARENDPDYQVPDLHTYFAILCPTGINADDVALGVAVAPEVEWAYVAAGPTPPPVNAADDPRQIYQGYEDPAPTGIDAEFAWTVAGGDGKKVGFVDLEQGWVLNHDDLKAAGITPISGSNHAYFGHGTAVLGAVCGVDNTLGVVGIAPACTARVVSQFQPSGYSTAGAIVSALNVMRFGDVLLLEAQTKLGGSTSPYVPVEAEQAEFDMIRLAAALGVIVVEAAGNGGVNLNGLANSAGAHFLDRTSAAFRDSGAIMVGAGTSAVPHVRRAGSNFGNRVDCYAWGSDVHTAGDGSTGTDPTAYTAIFGGTSSAAAIVGGAALCVQGTAVAKGFICTPAQMRALLSDPALGTLSGNPAADQVGVMPNLKEILTNRLGLAPDVYLRDHLADDGGPHTGPVSASPDVILRSTSVPNPQAAFGQGSGTEQLDTLGDQAVGGQNNYLYVRTLNRGGGAAVNVTATVYWSPVSTLVTPDLWTLVGSVVIPNVPSGNQLTVSNAIPWPAGQVPATGHYCLVGVVGTHDDPPPLVTDLLDWTTFLRFVRENNNITWRNINVVSNVPPPASSGGSDEAVPLAFLTAGAPAAAVVMQLDILARLPEGARLMLLAPEPLLDSFRVPNNLRSRRSARGDRTRSMIPLNPHGESVIGRALFPPGIRHELELHVWIPARWRESTYEVIARQSHEEVEIGRVTWRIGPDRRTGSGRAAARRKHVRPRTRR
jgi:hypothetical protein